MPVQTIVAAARAAAKIPHKPTKPPVVSKKTQPIPKIPVGRKVSAESTASRDNQDDRHCENVVHARSGRPRWKAEEARPPTASSSAIAVEARPKLALGGNRPNGAPSPSKIKSA